MMSTATASERTERDHGREHGGEDHGQATADDVQRFMMGVFQLQAKVTEVGQMAMALSAQAATLSGLMSVGVTPMSVLSAGATGTIEVPQARVPRGTPPPPVTDGEGVQEPRSPSPEPAGCRRTRPHAWSARGSRRWARRPSRRSVRGWRRRSSIRFASRDREHALDDFRFQKTHTDLLSTALFSGTYSASRASVRTRIQPLWTK